MHADRSRVVAHSQQLQTLVTPFMVAFVSAVVVVADAATFAGNAVTPAASILFNVCTRMDHGGRVFRMRKRKKIEAETAAKGRASDQIRRLEYVLLLLLLLLLVLVLAAYRRQ